MQPIAIIQEFCRFDRTCGRANPTNFARRPLSCRKGDFDDVLIARIAQGERLAMQVPPFHLAVGNHAS
jgi:hypothetical protein